jgi:hypothetical protein
VSRKPLAVGGAAIEATAYGWRDLPGFLAAVSNVHKRNGLDCRAVPKGLRNGARLRQAAETARSTGVAQSLDSANPGRHRRAAITLPEEVHSPIAKAVFDELVERGLAVRRLGAMTAVCPSPG